MARVLIYSLVFPPDGVSTAQIMGELAQDLRTAGHDVKVITTRPHYNRDLIAERAQPLRPVYRKWVSESSFDGIPVLHIDMPRERGSSVQRAKGWLGFHLLGLLLGLKSVPSADVIITPSPLLSAGVIAWTITKLRGGTFVYNVQELYPELAVQMGRLSNPVLIHLFRKLERFVYAKAAAIVGITSAICKHVIEQGTPPQKVHLITNFVDLEVLAPLPRDNAFAREHGLMDDFVVSYAGNMGHAQGLESIIESASLHSEDDRTRYVLIGDGVLRERIAESVRDRGLRNVMQLAHQPFARMPEIYAASDVCLVPLVSGVDGTALPSKVLRIMACARPILAVCDPGSEMADIIRQAKSGVVVPPGQPKLLLKAIEQLARNPSMGLEMGASGRAFVEREFDRRIVSQRYSRLIEQLAQLRVGG